MAEVTLQAAYDEAVKALGEATVVQRLITGQLNEALVKLAEYEQSSEDGSASG